ncbi:MULTISPECIES: bacteriocin immunity protein [Lactococcus]|uniref:Bacteriocin immunity protein n=2 Tax=Lactococcus petauri TaxID=1940789 RepID=A0AAJ2MPP4_9LACT|nr:MULTISPECIES: bacteriocin immunity protein [Lactococcus]QQB43419.1 bacteriocin immunity protein [Lactococcus garvieae]MDT2583231.1 bacteriocin immunity protein [Lactococcus petauri]NSL26239.1 bacteriocin immunity protein [Lactococcus petauri]CEF50349.1 Enterocin A Immunity [Lactococcus garvieae]BAV02907.1 Enterocin A Immunity [Lactococcus formosensis]
MKQSQQYEQDKKEFLNLLYNFVLSEDITTEERRVITKAKDLIEQGEYIVVVIRRLERTLAIKSMSEKRSPKIDDLYKKLPDLIYNFTIYPYTYGIFGEIITLL